LKPINLEETRKNAESYILVNIGDQEVSLFVDVGASCCIVTQEFLKSLGTIYRKIEKPLSLLPADGGNMEILGYATIVLTIGQKVNLCVEFAVVKRCVVVPFVLGLDLCQVLKARVDYKTSTLEIDWENK
jgi:predicted aspartyl protease